MSVKTILNKHLKYFQFSLKINIFFIGINYIFQDFIFIKIKTFQELEIACFFIEDSGLNVQTDMVI